MKKIIDIICVEDDHLYQQMIGMSFEMADDVVVNLMMFEKSDEAEKYYANIIATGGKKPHLILLDINLPTSSFDGIELLEKINGKYGNGVIIGMETGTNDRREIDRCKALGGMFVLHKDSDYDITIPELVSDLPLYRKNELPFKIYK